MDDSDMLDLEQQLSSLTADNPSRTPATQSRTERVMSPGADDDLLAALKKELGEDV